MTATATITPAPIMPDPATLPVPECPVAFLAALLPIVKAAAKANRFQLARIFARTVGYSSAECPGWVEVWATDGHRLVTLRHCPGEPTLPAAKAAAANTSRSSRPTGPTYAWSIEEATVAIARAKATKKETMVKPSSDGEGAPPMDNVMPVWATYIGFAPACPKLGMGYLAQREDVESGGMHPVPLGWCGNTSYVADIMRVGKDAGIASGGKHRVAQSMGVFGDDEKCLSPALWQATGPGPGRSTFAMLAVVMPFRI